MARVLVADDDEDLRGFLCDALEPAGHDIEAAPDGAHALDLLARRSFDVLLTDLNMPGLTGDALVRQARARWPMLAVVALTAHGTVRSTVDLMRLGAVDVLEKPVESPAALRAVIARAASASSATSATDTSGTDELRLTWGALAMVPVEAALRRVAVTDSTVLLLGESGTGKEVAARALHG